MRLEEYIPLAMRTNPKKSKKDNLLNACLGLSGEYAEYIVETKTLDPYELYSKKRMLDELSDIYWYVALLHETLGFQKVSLANMDEVLFFISTMRESTLHSNIGAICDLIKKHVFQGHTLDIEKARIILLNLNICLDEEIERQGFFPEEVRNYNVQKLMKRFPQGFEVEKSVNRKE